MSPVRALVDAIRKKIEFALAEDQIVNESIVFGNVDSYNMQELMECNRLHHRQLWVSYRKYAQHNMLNVLFCYFRLLDLEQ